MPVWNIYRSQTSDEPSRFSESKSSLSTFSLGNMGFSKTECLTESIFGQNHVELACSSAGYITELLDFGVTTAQEDQMQCTRKIGMTCNTFLNPHHVELQFQERCVKQKSCNLTQLRKIVSDKSTEQCNGPEARFFVQYKCEQDFD